MVCLYIIFCWAGETTIITGIKNRVLSARILTSGKKLRTKQENGKLIITGLPVRPPDKYGTVIKLELDGRSEASDYSKISLV